MKRLVPITMLAVVLLCSPIGPAAAAEDPAGEAGDAVEALRVSGPACAETALPAPSLEGLSMPPAQPVCSCRDRCFNDAQCEMLYGPGSRCVPVGSCQCRECLATS